MLDAIEEFDQRYFSYTQRRQHKLQAPKEEESHEDELKLDQKDKKALRREARAANKAKIEIEVDSETVVEGTKESKPKKSWLGSKN